jgi:putative transcriptional regulator
MTAMFDDLMYGLDEVNAFLGGKTAGYKVSVPAEVDVKSIRKHLNMTQAGFSRAFGFSIDAVKHWEGGRRTPEASARAFLTVIARNPEAVIRALHPSAAPSRRSAGKKPALKAAACRANAVPKSTHRST